MFFNDSRLSACGTFQLWRLKYTKSPQNTPGFLTEHMISVPWLLPRLKPLTWRRGNHEPALFCFTLPEPKLLFPMPTDVFFLCVIFPRASLLHHPHNATILQVTDQLGAAAPCSERIFFLFAAPAAQWTPARVLLYVPVAVIKLNGLELLSSWQAVSWLSEVSLVQGAIWMGFLSTMSVPRNLLLRSIHKNKKKEKTLRHYFPHLSPPCRCQSRKKQQFFFPITLCAHQ